jgi:hypothetical protein
MACEQREEIQGKRPKFGSGGISGGKECYMEANADRSTALDRDGGQEQLFKWDKAANAGSGRGR